MNRRRIQVVVLATVSIVLAMFPAPATAQNARSSPVAPRKEMVESVVREAYEKFKGETKGKNADYIPYLAHVDSKSATGKPIYKLPGDDPSTHSFS